MFCNCCSECVGHMLCSDSEIEFTVGHIIQLQFNIYVSQNHTHKLIFDAYILQGLPSDFNASYHTTSQQWLWEWAKPLPWGQGSLAGLQGAVGCPHILPSIASWHLFPDRIWGCCVWCMAGCENSPLCLRGCCSARLTGRVLPQDKVKWSGFLDSGLKPGAMVLPPGRLLFSQGELIGSSRV